MNINANNKPTSNKGFTIVELLIVIVVIGILAAIVIVAYNGVQDQARTTAAQSNAKEIVNKAEVYAVEHDGVYPTTTNFDAATGGETWQLSETAEDAVEDAADPAPTEGSEWDATKEDTIVLQNCDSGDGVQVFYQEYSEDTYAAPLTGGDTSNC